MNEHIVRQAEEMMRAAQDVRVPENMQAIAEEGVAKTREVYNRMAAAAKDGAKAVEEIAMAQQAGAKILGDKILQNVLANTEAALDAAQAMARSKTLPDAARVQADFMQQQIAKAGEQTREFLELSTRIAQQTLQTANAAATKSFSQIKTH